MSYACSGWLGDTTRRSFGLVNCTGIHTQTTGISSFQLNIIHMSLFVLKTN
jgi:hypothetical protein